MNFFNLFENDFLFVFPELFIATAIVFLLSYGVIFSTSDYYKSPALAVNVSWLSFFTLGIAFLLCINNFSSSMIIFNNMLIINPFTSLIKAFILLSSMACILISINYLDYQRINTFEYSILILLSVLGMLCLVSTYDLLSLYLAVELMSLSFYILAAYKRNSEFSGEAGLKYFILGAFSSGLLLFGSSILYGMTGLTNFHDINQLFVDTGDLTKIDFGLARTSIKNMLIALVTLIYGDINLIEFYCHNDVLPICSQITGSKIRIFNLIFFRDLYTFPNGYGLANFSYSLIIIGILFISIALLFKIAAAPFHMWSPDVYEGSPTPVTAFFSSVPKVALLALYLRLFFFPFENINLVWDDLFLVCAMISMVWGSIAALSQTRIKRLMAYSGIVNVGYMLIGIASGPINSVGSLLVYLFIYVVMTIGFFSFILGTQNYKTKGLNVYLLDLTNLGKTNIVLGLAVSLILFSMIGLPPLAGFFGKVFLFFAAMNSNHYSLAILGVMSSVVAAFYYIRLIKLMFFEMSSKRFTLYKQMDQVNAYVLSISLLLLIIFFASADALLLSCHRIAMFIFL